MPGKEESGRRDGIAGYDPHLRCNSSTRHGANISAHGGLARHLCYNSGPRTIARCHPPRNSSPHAAWQVSVTAGIRPGFITNRPCKQPKTHVYRPASAPFVYRLGRQIFNLERGVRFP